MAITAGQVDYLKVSSGYGFVNIRRDDPSGPPTELLIIWFGDHSEGPAALFTTELSLALARGLRVRIFHSDDSAYIAELTINAP
jgi:hypothetical protein